MLIQHILTKDLFVSIFDNSNFHCENIIAKSLFLRKQVEYFKIKFYMQIIEKIKKANININSYNRKFYLIFFVTIFAFLFLNIYKPFEIYNSSNQTKEDIFFELLIAIFIVFIILVFTQFVIKSIVKIKYSTILSYIFWFFIEAILVSLAWSALDFYQILNSQSFFNILFENFIAYILIMFFPYFIFGIMVYVKDFSQNKIFEQKISEQNTNILNDTESKNIIFNDENNIAKLFVKQENIIFIQSADNYLEINYLENGKLSKFLLRNSMKNIESQIIQGAVFRCHRSFIVNTNNIELAIKTTSGYNLTLKHFSNFQIPVSKSYISELKKYLKIIS